MLNFKILQCTIKKLKSEKFRESKFTDLSHYKGYFNQFVEKGSSGNPA